MERVTKKDIDGALKTLNRMIKHKGIQVVQGGEYGYIVLYLCELESSGTIKRLRGGCTKREALQAVFDMMTGVEWIIDRPAARITNGMKLLKWSVLMKKNNKITRVLRVSVFIDGDEEMVVTFSSLPRAIGWVSQQAELFGTDVSAWTIVDDSV